MDVEIKNALKEFRLRENTAKYLHKVFSQHTNDRRTAETHSVVEQNLHKYSTANNSHSTKLSCKAAEIAATRSLNAH